jgi:hypothetical protein
MDSSCTLHKESFRYFLETTDMFKQFYFFELKEKEMSAHEDIMLLNDKVLRAHDNYIALHNELKALIEDCAERHDTGSCINECGWHNIPQLRYGGLCKPKSSTYKAVKDAEKAYNQLYAKRDREIMLSREESNGYDNVRRYRAGRFSY